MLIQVDYNLLKWRQAPASPTPGLGKCALAPRCTGTRASFVGSRAAMGKTEEDFLLTFQGFRPSSNICFYFNFTFYLLIFGF